MLKFAFSEAKAMAALGLIAKVRPGLTPLFVSKILFFAEKWHINRYGRPIIADTYIAMPRGPVPSTVKNFIDENWKWVDKPERFEDFIGIDNRDSLRRLIPGVKEPDLSLLSGTDVDCITDAVKFCDGKTADELSEITHFEKSWRRVPVNSPMNFEDFIDDDNAHKEDILLEMYDTAASGVL